MKTLQINMFILNDAKKLTAPQLLKLNLNIYYKIYEVLTSYTHK